MLFTHPTIPTYFVVRQDEMLYLVPDIPNGWRQRRPFLGHKISLKPVPPNQARLYLANIGVPDA
jgi:hypothetical protein